MVKDESDEDVDETSRLRPSVSDVINSPSPGTQLYLHTVIIL